MSWGKLRMEISRARAVLPEPTHVAFDMMEEAGMEAPRVFWGVYLQKTFEKGDTPEDTLRSLAPLDGAVNEHGSIVDLFSRWRDADRHAAWLTHVRGRKGMKYVVLPWVCFPGMPDPDLIEPP